MADRAVNVMWSTMPVAVDYDGCSRERLTSQAPVVYASAKVWPS